jgi:hypothetical protein
MNPRLLAIVAASIAASAHAVSPVQPDCAVAIHFRGDQAVLLHLLESTGNDRHFNCVYEAGRPPPGGSLPNTACAGLTAVGGGLGRYDDPQTIVVYAYWAGASDAWRAEVQLFLYEFLAAAKKLPQVDRIDPECLKPYDVISPPADPESK